MANLDSSIDREGGVGARLLSWLIRIFVAVGIPLLAFVVIYYGFIFLRDSEAPRAVIAGVAIVWGVGGVALLYWVFNSIVERLPDEWTARLQPFVFVGPAMAILLWYLAFPVLRTFWLSLFGRDGPPSGFGHDRRAAERRLRRVEQLRVFVHGTPAAASAAQQCNVDRLRQYDLCGAWLAGGNLGRPQQVRACLQIIDLPSNGDLLCRRQRDLELHLRCPPGWFRPDRPVECYNGHAGRCTPCLGQMGGYCPMEQPLPDRDRHLAAGRVTPWCCSQRL